jgi:hypothetical protein
MFHKKYGRIRNMLYNVLKMPLQFDDDFDDYFPEEEKPLSIPDEINNLEDAFIPISDTPRTIQSSNPFYVKFLMKNTVKLYNPFERKPHLFQNPVIINFPMLKWKLNPFYKRYALSNLLIDYPELAKSVHQSFTFHDPSKIKKPIIFKKKYFFTRISVRSMDYYFPYSPNSYTFQSAIEYDHGRIKYFSCMNCKQKEFITERRLRSMERNYFNTFICLNGHTFNLDDNPYPERWRIKSIPFQHYNLLKKYRPFPYCNHCWYHSFKNSLITLYNIFHIVKHCKNDLSLFEIMVMNVKNARFLPQIKAFMQEITVDDIPIKPSPPVKFNKCLLKCNISQVHEPDDIISGDGVKNYTRAVRLYKILFNLHDCIYQMNCYSFMNERLHSPLTEKQKENYMNIYFLCQWKENEPLFDSSKTKDYEVTIPFLKLTEKEEEDAYHYLKEQSYLLTRHESLSIFESIKI